MRMGLGGCASGSPSPGPETRDLPDPGANPVTALTGPRNAVPGSARNATVGSRPQARAVCHIDRDFGSCPRFAGFTCRRASPRGLALRQGLRGDSFRTGTEEETNLSNTA